MALDGRRGGPKPGPERRSPSVPTAQPYDRERYPPPAAPAERERSPLRADPYDDRYRDAYREPPLPREFYRREDPYADPYRRPPPPPADDPYYDRYRDDPYRYPALPPRRDPYADPYRDPYYRDIPPVRKPPPPLDCQIIILNQALMKFAEFLERKLKVIPVYCSIGVITEDRTIPQMVEEAAKRQCLFAVVINSQNEAHQSLTVNILHGTPQEHRNMPVEDAINLIKRSFDAYQAAKREKEAAAARPPAAPAARAPPPFVPPSQDIIYLLNLLADKRQLTVEEMDKVITYLTDRRDKLLEAEGRLPPKSYDNYGAGEPKAVDAQKDLQAKILSILNGPGEGVSSVPPPQPHGNGALDHRPGPGGMSSLINLDNPNVQKALDNLIQSGPNLLKTLSNAPGIPSQPGAALMSRESQHALSQPQATVGREPGYPPQRVPGMMPTARPQYPGAQPLMGAPGGMQPRRPPPPQY